MLFTVSSHVYSQACPYFVSRSVAEEADIIFCPYNYIVDPGIRLSVRTHPSHVRVAVFVPVIP